MRTARPGLGTTVPFLFLTPLLWTGQPTPASPGTWPADTQQTARDDHPRPDPSRIHRFDRQEIRLEDFAADGYVLDIGGGGEGVIGQLEPRQVVAEPHGVGYFRDLAARAGFEVVGERATDRTFFLELRNPTRGSLS